MSAYTWRHVAQSWIVWQLQMLLLVKTLSATHAKEGTGTVKVGDTSLLPTDYLFCRQHVTDNDSWNEMPRVQRLVPLSVRDKTLSSTCMQICLCSNDQAAI